MKIGAVIVTYNRIKELRCCLAAYEAQTLPPAFVLVVDNHSTDGTKEWLDEWAGGKLPFMALVHHLDQNYGGCGGFYRGMEAAMQKDFDWLWIADDDAYPAPDALEKLAAFMQSHPKETGECSALCAAVMDRACPQQVIPGHRRRMKKGFLNIPESIVSTEEYKKEYFSLDLFSYVGTAIKKETLQTAGLPEKDYFIYYDDSEHSVRVRRAGPIYCVPACKILHPNAPPENHGPLKWKDYYSIRNVLLEYQKNFPGRYYAMRLLRCYANALLSKTAERRTMYLEAIREARAGHKGLHPVYKPGWMSKAQR